MLPKIVIFIALIILILIIALVTIASGQKMDGLRPNYSKGALIDETLTNKELEALSDHHIASYYADVVYNNNTDIRKRKRNNLQFVKNVKYRRLYPDNTYDDENRELHT
jgi:hypothetical protein